MKPNEKSVASNGSAATAKGANAAAPQRKAITNKLRFVAKHRGLRLEDAWKQFVAPVVDAEFRRCVKESEESGKRS